MDFGIGVNLMDETQRLLEKYGWNPAGSGYWDHPSYPMEQFTTEQAVAIAREMCRKDLQVDQ